MTNDALIYNNPDIREKYRTGAVDVATAAEDSGLCGTPHISDTDAWIAMDDKGREAYSATAGEIHGQASFIGDKAHCFFKIWDSVGFWIATRKAALVPKNIERLNCTVQTFSANETEEKRGEMGICEGISLDWLRKFEIWLNNIFTNEK